MDQLIRSVRDPLRHCGALLLRTLRKKSVLALIVAFSFLYCVISLINYRRTVSLTTGGTVRLGRSFLGSLIDCCVPQFPQTDYDPIQDQDDDLDTGEFAFLKRQHRLKETLNDSADPTGQQHGHLASNQLA